MNLWLHPKDGEAYHQAVEFITSRIWGDPVAVSTGTVLAVAKDGEVIGACLFHNYQPEVGVIELTASSRGAGWVNRAVLRDMADYAFGQMKCQAVAMRVDARNTRMCRIAGAFGFQRYDVPHMRGRDRAEAVFVLTDTEAKTNRFLKEA